MGCEGLFAHTLQSGDVFVNPWFRSDKLDALCQAGAMMKSQRIGIGVVTMVIVGALVVLYARRPVRAPSSPQSTSLGGQEGVARPQQKPVVPGLSQATRLAVVAQPTPEPTAEPARVPEPGPKLVGAHRQRDQREKETLNPGKPKTREEIPAPQKAQTPLPNHDTAGARFMEGTTGAGARFVAGATGAGARFMEGATGAGARFVAGAELKNPTPRGAYLPNAAPGGAYRIEAQVALCKADEKTQESYKQALATGEKDPITQAWVECQKRQKQIQWQVSQCDADAETKNMFEQALINTNKQRIELAWNQCRGMYINTRVSRCDAGPETKAAYRLALMTGDSMRIAHAWFVCLKNKRPEKE